MQGLKWYIIRGNGGLKADVVKGNILIIYYKCFSRNVISSIFTNWFYTSFHVHRLQATVLNKHLAL